MLLSNLSFGSLYTYCPRESDMVKNDEIKQSKNLMLQVKHERTVDSSSKFISQMISEKIKEQLVNLPFKDFFDEDVCLVPVPKSSFLQKHALWVPLKLSRELENQGLGYCHVLLERVSAVPKSSLSESANRPKAKEHFDSIRIVPSIIQPKKIVLVDDVITRGATMLGCASVLKKNFPNAQIKGFAVIRTISNPEDFQQIEEPSVGQIILRGEETFRSP